MLQETITSDQPSRRWAGLYRPAMLGGFTAEDHAVWDLLFARQVDLLGSRVVSPFLDGIDLLRLSHPGVPELDELNAILEPRTGWRTVAVPGLVPDDIFFAMLGERVFPVGNFIRTRDQLDYLEAPDCFHDLFGHIPMLAHHDFAEMAQHIGELGICGDRGRRRAQRGAALLAQRRVRAGAASRASSRSSAPGLASSFGESHFSLESEEVERLPFSVERAVNTPYKHDAFQPRYLVSQSLDGRSREVLALTPEAAGAQQAAL